MATKAAPKSLGKAGTSLWRAVASKYELRPDEYSILEQAAATADMIAELEAAREDQGRPLVSTGSMGQEVIHPFIGELRAQRSQMAALMARLKLPDEASAPQDASSAARKAAATRWSRGA